VLLLSSECGLIFFVFCFNVFLEVFCGIFTYQRNNSINFLFFENFKNCIENRKIFSGIFSHSNFTSFDQSKPFFDQSQRKTLFGNCLIVSALGLFSGHSILHHLKRLTLSTLLTPPADLYLAFAIWLLRNKWHCSLVRSYSIMSTSSLIPSIIPWTLTAILSVAHAIRLPENIWFCSPVELHTLSPSILSMIIPWTLTAILSVTYVIRLPENIWSCSSVEHPTMSSSLLSLTIPWTLTANLTVAQAIRLPENIWFGSPVELPALSSSHLSHPSLILSFSYPLFIEE